MRRKTWRIVSRPEANHEHETRKLWLLHSSESYRNDQQASLAWSMPPDVAMPTHMASMCCSPKERESERGSLSSLPRYMGGSTALRHGICGVQRKRQS